MSSRQLAVFDFDETLIGACCMRQILKFLPDYRRPPAYDFAKKGWIEYANSVFKELLSMGYSLETLCKFICSLPPIPGMPELIQHLWNSSVPQYDLIIVSDSFSIFVINWLKAHKLFKCFTGIYCNPTTINDSGELIVDSYHCASCPFSPPNFCKNRVLNEFLSMQQQLNINYDRVVYIGNGRNDFCPTLNMRSRDLVCARKDDVLAEKIQKNRKKMKIQPKLYLWIDGYELLDKLAQ
ncbi:pyridoxal phosphate phosphatase PHOSPHO2-like [Anastrepha ludens]|uniref:pyridoxal phosphate phosphatase PHOSPHO2-like n=1 Tax=Anastrepha ludens TaxID=28586 RepID=UPI0023AEBD65|nr:pyridoxal phosphate phosphatase PHOSPHO2-like [Anastrepha ludens]